LVGDYDSHRIDSRVIDEGVRSASQDRCAAKVPILLWDFRATASTHPASGGNDQGYAISHRLNSPSLNKAVHLCG
jgi:hypothetical protein